MKIEWSRDTRQYSNGLIAKMGRVPVGSTFYDSCTSKDNPLKWAGSSRLPGFVGNAKKNFETEAEARTHVEKVTRDWFREVGATFAETEDN